MIVIIPLDCNGQYFKKPDHNLPKPLIKSQGKEIIFWTLDFLKFKKKTNIKIYLIYDKDLNIYDFKKRVLFNYPKINFYEIKDNKSTVKKIKILTSSLRKNYPNEKVLILNNDNFYKNDIIDISLNLNMNNIFFSKKNSKSHDYCYLKINKKKEILKVTGKSKISHNVGIGAFFFKKLDELDYFLKLNLKKNNKNSIFELCNDMMNSKIAFKGFEFKNSDFIEIDTPKKLKKFSMSNPQEKKRFCFDLDQTLVTIPTVPGDYRTVLPIKNKINFLRYLKSNGHYIIIYTARKMRSHKGDIKKVIKDIKDLTTNQLKKFKIPYDELIFGKPYAHYYIDDLAINAYENLQNELGYYDNDF